MKGLLFTFGVLCGFAFSSCPEHVASTCHNDEDCSGHGICNESTGTCQCKAGYQGEICNVCAEGYYELEGECRECISGFCCDENGNLLKESDVCNDNNPCTVQDECKSCDINQSGCVDGLTCKGEPIECAQDDNLCLEASGTCDPNHLDGNCGGFTCCKYNPIWDGEREQPVCPFAGEEELPEPEWSGVCDIEGICVGCTEDAQCDDKNPCTENKCVSGTCKYTNFEEGIDCTVNSEGDGTCLLRGQTAVCLKDIGVGCKDDSDCVSNACVDGVCCQDKCEGKCRTCNLEGSVGTCENVPDGQDPDEDCVKSNDCQLGYCNGKGKCALQPEKHECEVCKECNDKGECVVPKEEGTWCNEEPPNCSKCDSQGDCVHIPEDCFCIPTGEGGEYICPGRRGTTFRSGDSFCVCDCVLKSPNVCDWGGYCFCK